MNSDLSSQSWKAERDKCSVFFISYVGLILYHPSPFFLSWEGLINIHHCCINQPPSLILTQIKVRYAKSLFSGLSNALFSFPFFPITGYVLPPYPSLTKFGLSWLSGLYICFSIFFLPYYNLISWPWHIYSDGIETKNSAPEISSKI